jgi:hypothetical protein
MLKRLFTLSLLLLLIAGSATAQETDENNQGDDMPASDGLAVTVYNEGSALVQDRRTFSLNAGENLVNFTDVASQIDATSVIFTSLTDPEGTSVLEQNYVYDLVDSSALLARYLDETIQVTTEDGTLFEGQLLSGRNGEIILRDANGQIQVIRQQNARNIQFPDLPEGLITRPTLRWLLNSAASGEQQVELTYLTQGISWTADYNVLLTTDNNALDLNGWVTLDNRSGTAYENALLKLVAGDVNRLPQDELMAQSVPEVAFARTSADQAVQQREFFEYQLYEVSRPVTVGNNETKQVEFVTGAGVPANTFFVYNASPRFNGYGGPILNQGYGQTGITDVQNFLEFSTGEENGLGADLPAGRVRVYQEDVDGAALLIGENRIDHTPEGEDVQLFLGNAFDLVGERTQTSYRQLSSRVIQESYEIRLRNRKDNETVEIRVPERLTRWSNWEILQVSDDFTQTDSFGIEFRVDVEPGQERIITYTVQYTFPQ